jgi:prophage tail gpP-like protein
MATEHKLDKLRFRDGGRISEEVFRVGTENAHFMWEGRDGKLVVTDDNLKKQGVALILGDNILTFSAEQSEHEGKSEVTVKGKRTDKTIRGKASLVATKKTVKDSAVKTRSPLVIHHYGDGDDEALERRAKFESNKRNSTTKNVKIEVFHVQTPSGEPWDVGLLHQVSIPPEGLSTTLECIGVEYSVDATGTLKTGLTLAPPPTGVSGGSSGFSGLAGAAVQVALGVVANSAQDADYPSPWTGPQLSLAVDVEGLSLGVTLPVISKLEDEVPLTLPDTT